MEISYRIKALRVWRRIERKQRDAIGLYMKMYIRGGNNGPARRWIEWEQDRLNFRQSIVAGIWQQAKKQGL